MTHSPAQQTTLLDQEIPLLDKTQLQLFQYDKLRVIDEGEFDLQHALDSLHNNIGKHVIGIDIGGDKAVTQLFKVSDQGLTVDESLSDFRQDENGVGYLESLERTAAFAKENNIPVGLSLGVPMNGSKPANPKKLPVLYEGLRPYGYDFSVLIPTLKACLNDGPAGLISGAMHANLTLPNTPRYIVYIINGGGIGAAVLKNGKIFATEAGHTIPVSEQLNRYSVTRQCGVFDATHVCFELVASNKKGIEAIWHDKTGERLSAIAIEKRFTQHEEKGDLALELYGYSAFMIAHVVKGLASAFAMPVDDPSFIFIGHGGAFKFPEYGSRIKQILDHNTPDANINTLLTNTYTKNACLDGAALYAIANTSA